MSRRPCDGAAAAARSSLPESEQRVRPARRRRPRLGRRSPGCAAPGPAARHRGRPLAPPGAAAADHPADGADRGAVAVAPRVLELRRTGHPDRARPAGGAPAGRRRTATRRAPPRSRAGVSEQDPVSPRPRPRRPVRRRGRGTRTPRPAPAAATRLRPARPGPGRARPGVPSTWSRLPRATRRPSARRRRACSCTTTSPASSSTPEPGGRQRGAGQLRPAAPAGLRPGTVAGDQLARHRQVEQVGHRAGSAAARARRALRPVAVDTAHRGRRRPRRPGPARPAPARADRRRCRRAPRPAGRRPCAARRGAPSGRGRRGGPAGRSRRPTSASTSSTVAGGRSRSSTSGAAVAGSYSPCNSVLVRVPQPVGPLGRPARGGSDSHQRR